MTLDRGADRDAVLSDGGPRLLLATFGRLLWWTPSTERHDVIHEGGGKYYGLAPAGAIETELASIFVVSRPDQDRDDALLELDVASGRELGRTQIASRDTHHIFRDGDRLLIADTWRGHVLEYLLPELSLKRTYLLFNHENHINSILTEGDDLYVLCHNRGKSSLSLVDRTSGVVIDEWPDVGALAHDIVTWAGAFVICDSDSGGIIIVERDTKTCRTLWSDEGHFSKGLIIEDDVAYFGISKARRREDRYDVDCDVVAFDLRTESVIWRRQVETRGLLNSIATSRSLMRHYGLSERPTWNCGQPSRAGPDT